ncbi:MAG: HAMP domain-containing histidine kinase [Acidimicrobiia bacterium]|nr:HAMP domain-containing histidine kinase [Acidimicrobiia bacterium]
MSTASVATGTIDFKELAPTFHTVRAFTVASTAAALAVLGAAWDPRLVWTLLVLAGVALVDAVLRRGRPEASPRPRLLVEALVVTLTVLLIGGPALVAAPMAYLLTAALLILPLRRALLVVAFLTACVVGVFFSAIPAADTQTQWWLGLGAVLVFLAALSILLVASLRVNTKLRTREAALLTEAQAANLAKTELLANVSHELRTPLAGVVGFAQLLRDDTGLLTDADRTEAIRSIAEQSFELAALIDDLLIAARYEIGELSVTAVRTSLRAQAAQVLENWDQRIAATITLEGETGPAVADPARVRQIVRNLISNALRYGGPKIGVLLTSDETTTNIQVRDNGPGIPTESEEHIFDAYYRVPGQSQHAASIGLGLAVSRDLARLMNGDITYRRHEGETIFELQLPLADKN